MNTVRSYFATTVAFLVVAIGWWAADAVVCCNSSSVASGGGDVVASCQNKNRMFHMIETFYGVCDDNSTAVSIRKCCPLGQFYDPNLNLCRLAGMDGFEHLQRMTYTLDKKTREYILGQIGYIYEKPLCGSGYVLVDLSTEEMHIKFQQHISGFSEEGCFDLTASKELVARKCQQRDQYCGQVDYTCVHSCCMGDRMIVDGPNVPKCIQNEKQFTMTAYKLDEDGRPSSGSNNRVLPYYLKVNSFHEDYKTYHEFKLTTDGRLFLPSNGHFVPYTEYCVGYSQVTDSIVAFIWEADNVFVGTHVRDNSTPLFYQTSYVASAVCLVLTLFLYNILPSLRKIHNYYVKCYMHHQFMLCICVIYQMSMEQKKKEDTCSLFGYFTLFVFLSTLCWLNVICFDIYWKIRYNISSSRNPSTTLCTIMYHFYCWGLSSIFVCTGLFFQYSQDESLQGLAPDFKAYGCFYYKIPGYRGLIFILMPVFVMLTVNLILFWLTAIHSSRIKSELNNFNPTDSKTKSFLVYKEIFVISIKLCLIMELPYLPTILSYSLHRKWTKRYIIYAASSLQGVLIFIVFVAKHKVIMDLRKKCISSMGYSKPTQIDNISE